MKVIKIEYGRASIYGTLFTYIVENIIVERMTLFICLRVFYISCDFNGWFGGHYDNT